MEINDVIQDETFQMSQIENPSNQNEEMNREEKEEIDKESQQDGSENTDDETEKFDKEWAQNCSEITEELTNMILDLIFNEKPNSNQIAENFDSKSEIEEMSEGTKVAGTGKIGSETEEQDRNERRESKETNSNEVGSRTEPNCRETFHSLTIDDETKTKKVENAEPQTEELRKGTTTENMDSETEKLDDETNSRTENKQSNNKDSVDLEREQNFVELSQIQAEKMEQETDDSDCEVEEIDMSTDGEEERSNSFDTSPKKEETVQYVTIHITKDKKQKNLIEETKKQEERKENDTDGEESKTDKDTNEEEEGGRSDDPVYVNSDVIDNNTDRQVDLPKSCITSKEIEPTEREDSNTDKSGNKATDKQDSTEENPNDGDRQTEEEDPSVHYRECLLCYRFFLNQDWLFLHIR